MQNSLKYRTWLNYQGYILSTIFWEIKASFFFFVASRKYEYEKNEKMKDHYFSLSNYFWWSQYKLFHFKTQFQIALISIFIRNPIMTMGSLSTSTFSNLRPDLLRIPIKKSFYNFFLVFPVLRISFSNHHPRHCHKLSFPSFTYLWTLGMDLFIIKWYRIAFSVEAHKSVH
jgi:hypothetical protein